MKRPKAEGTADSRPRHDGRPVHRIVFVTGKGGVGKSVVAAATALQHARAGRHVLLVEMGSRSFYGPLLGLPVGDAPVRWKPQVDVALWGVEAALREYILHYLVIKAAADRVLNNTIMKALVAAAPSLAELAMLGKLAAPMLHRWYKRDVDVVVVDGYSTGQFLALLRAPRGVAQTASRGPIHKHTTGITRVLGTPGICEYRLVTLAEELPVSEACELAEAIHEETGIAPRVYCNRMLDLPRELPAVEYAGPADRFVAHMDRIAARQRRGVAALTRLGSHRQGPVQRLPFVPTLDAEELLDALADALDAAEGEAT